MKCYILNGQFHFGYLLRRILCMFRVLSRVYASSAKSLLNDSEICMDTIDSM